MNKIVSTKKKKIAVAVSLFLAFAVLLAASAYAYIRNGGLFVDVLPHGGVSLVFLSVGQASCTLILSEEGIIVIDTGSNDSEETVLSALSYYGVKTVDHLILTHADEDHAGGLDAILNAYPVKNVMLTKTAYEELGEMREGKTLETALASKETALFIVSAGDSLTIGPSRLEILAPTQYDEELSGGGNASSLIMLFEYGETRAILSGDADETAELLALSALAKLHPGLSYDILLVGHHGSASSSCEQFVDYLAPRYAVISCGEGNTYGHPSIEVLKRLESVGAEILRTDRNGTVILHSDGETVTTVSSAIKSILKK